MDNSARSKLQAQDLPLHSSNEVVDKAHNSPLPSVPLIFVVFGQPDCRNCGAAEWLCPNPPPLRKIKSAGSVTVLCAEYLPGFAATYSVHHMSHLGDQSQPRQ
ncbi:hypothetical protein Bbelb_037470 [Branchiostoma belcheri]|nr:hypothetical protein Bbelb_037470 [Branchiostoma belcheri]